MSSMTIAKTRDNLSAIVSGIESGLIPEHLIRNRDRIVARILPVSEDVPVSRRIGISKDEPFLVDDEAFDAMDNEIAEMFGA